MKSIEFDIQGSAKHDKDDMPTLVREITRLIYKVEIDLTGVSLASYYRSDGAKITKTLTTLLRRQLPKEAVQEKFAGYAKAIAELYNTAKTLRATWGNMETIGTGDLEGTHTCFRPGAENSICRDFLQRYRRARLLVLYDKASPKEPCGRVIVFFAGGRNVILTNFYYRRIEPNQLYFIEAVRRMLGLKKVVYKSWKNFFLPIYLNRDAVLVYDERVRIMDTNKKLPCPHCGKVVHEKSFVYEEDGNYRLIGCSTQCARSSNTMFLNCDACGERHKSGRMKAVGEKKFCLSCYHSNLVTCHRCGTKIMEKDAKKSSDGSIACANCFEGYCFPCHICGDWSLKRNIIGTRLDDRYCVCVKCLTHSDVVCSVCRRAKANERAKIGKKTVKVCSTCASLYYERKGIVPVDTEIHRVSVQESEVRF